MGVARRNIRRVVALGVAASYLLAATAAGIFHNHSAVCCESGCETVLAHRHASCGHKHRHCHAGHEHKVAARKAKTEEGCPAHSPRKGGRHAPEKCAACQFLAEQSTPAPSLTLVVLERVTPHDPPAPAVVLPAQTADAHPPRGPPESA
jgi:hypothetical protein